MATHYQADGLGSIVKMTDAAGAVVDTRLYDAWGNIEVGANQSGYAYTGREWDPETRLYYNRARYYNPKVGLFISEDPLFGESSERYRYVFNRPTGATDPSGLYFFLPTFEFNAYQDGGLTWIDRERLKLDFVCAGCKNQWRLVFALRVHIQMRYAFYCPWWSSRHEKLHEAAIKLNVKAAADEALLPLERARYTSRLACEQAAMKARYRLEDAYRSRQDNGHAKIDNYWPCLYQGAQ